MPLGISEATVTMGDYAHAKKKYLDHLSWSMSFVLILSVLPKFKLLPTDKVVFQTKEVK